MNPWIARALIEERQREITVAAERARLAGGARPARRGHAGIGMRFLEMLRTRTRAHRNGRRLGKRRSQIAEVARALD